MFNKRTGMLELCTMTSFLLLLTNYISGARITVQTDNIIFEIFYRNYCSLEYFVRKFDASLCLDCE